ncbi:MAG: fibronectin type III domain-containing protein [Planctomycetota bacterium]|jgi:hypothetical protein
MKTHVLFLIPAVLLIYVLSATLVALPVSDDPLVRMPGTQPGQVSLESPNRCLNCHAGYNASVEPGFGWKGSMMAQSARDFLFWACMTVAAQDSQWATGRPNATDICERCHFPQGWLEGRSDPTNATLMNGSDYDGIHCDFCHRIYDPFFESTFSGTREDSDWLNYWDETGQSDTPSSPAAAFAHQADSSEAAAITSFNGNPFFENNHPFSFSYTENTSGQFFVAADSAKRAPFADAAARHQMIYSRHHKSKYFCGTCHDVSNPVLGNLPFNGKLPGDGTTVLTTEESAAHSYYHVERTFSEFMLSDYGQQGGTAGIGPFDPDTYQTSLANNNIAKCQDCHMRDVVGKAANKNGVPIRPTGSVEHPESGLPLHDLTGGNAWVSFILASAIQGSPNFDQINYDLLNQGPSSLTLDMTQGVGLDAEALIAGAERAKQQLELAASIQEVSYNASNGAVSFKLQNQTGHKLISGFPEGRRMFVNVKAYSGGTLIYEVNPYDAIVGTLRGLPSAYSPSSPALGANEKHIDELVYETHPSSTLTGEDETFHFALATERYKDNRIPPKGFRINEAADRWSVPRWHGDPNPSFFTAEEYAGGYDEVDLSAYGVSIVGADAIEINLYYQTTSREYIEFLRDEINGTGRLTLPASAYVIQTDDFYTQLRAWGDTIWQLWQHNMNLPGAAPYLMTQATVGTTPTPCEAPAPTLLSAVPSNAQVTLTWTDEHTADAGVAGYNVYYDQAGKTQLIADVGMNTAYVDSGLSNGQEYCYKVASYDAADCISPLSNILCAIPNNQPQTEVTAQSIQTGKTERIGKGKNATIEFVLTDSFAAGDLITVQAYVADVSTGLGIGNATVSIEITGPETTTLTAGPSDNDGLAQATWQTQSPNKKGQGGTSTGNYTATITGIDAAGYTWDAQALSAAFTIQ